MDGWRVLGKGVNENNKHQLYSKVADSRTLALSAPSINSINKSYMLTCHVHSCVLSILADTRIQSLPSSHRSHKRHKAPMEITEQNVI